MNIQNINSIQISFNKSFIGFNALYFFFINTKYIKTIKNNRQTNIFILFIDVYNQKENNIIVFIILISSKPDSNSKFHESK